MAFIGTIFILLFLFGIALLLDILFPDRFNSTSELFDWRWIDPSKDREVIRRKRRERKKEKKRLKRELRKKKEQEVDF